jgi:hypothetical protein
VRSALALEHDTRHRLIRIMDGSRFSKASAAKTFTRLGILVPKPHGERSRSYCKDNDLLEMPS